MEEMSINTDEMVRSIRDQFYEETKRMEPEELIAFITREASKAVQNGGQDGARNAAA